MQEDQFLLFTVHTADGRNIYVPTRDHIALSPARAIVTYDDDRWVVLPGLLMTGLTVENHPIASTKPQQP